MSERAPHAAAALAVAALGLVAVPAGPAGAQDWRTANTSRQRAGEAALEVQVRYGAGTLEVSPAARGELYRAGLRYDADQFEPIADYADGRLRIGVEGRGRGIRGRNLDRSELTLALSPDVDLDLDLDFGAVSGEIELGGLRVRELDVE